MRSGYYIAELTKPDESGKRFRIIHAVSREDAMQWLRRRSPIRRVKYYYQQHILREIIMPLLQDVTVERFNVYLSKAIRHTWKAKEPRIYTFP
jgi:hypothetical protein